MLVSECGEGGIPNVFLMCSSCVLNGKCVRRGLYSVLVGLLRFCSRSLLALVRTSGEARAARMAVWQKGTGGRDACH
jgi:hypothetical protein